MSKVFCEKYITSEKGIRKTEIKYSGKMQSLNKNVFNIFVFDKETHENTMLNGFSFGLIKKRYSHKKYLPVMFI